MTVALAPGEKLSKAIDFNRPLRIKLLDPTKKRDTRAVHYAGRLQLKPDDAVQHFVNVPYATGRMDGALIEIDEFGVPKPHQNGSGLRFENTPLETSGFYPLESTGALVPAARGVSTLAFAKYEWPVAKFILEIVNEDGVPVRAEIHHV